MHKQQAAQVPRIDHRRHAGSQLCAELFSNSPHWSLKVSPRHNRHPMTRGGSGGVQEVQLAAPRSTGGVTDNQHGGRERKELGGRGGEKDRNTKEGSRWRCVYRREREGEGKDGHYPNGSLCPIYPSHAAIPPRPRHRSFNWPSTQCLLKHSASLEKGSVGECGKLSHAGNI